MGKNIFRVGEMVVCKDTVTTYGYTKPGMVFVVGSIDSKKVIGLEQAKSTSISNHVDWNLVKIAKKKCALNFDTQGIYEINSFSDFYSLEVALGIDQGSLKKKAKVDFASVILPEEKKLQIEAALSQVENWKTIFKKWGFEDVMEKGTAISFLFYGSPGTGKTLMAQAIADKFDQPLLMVGSAEIESSTPGEAERNIKRYFAMARAERGRPTGKLNDQGEPILDKAEKCVLLFDECDSLITDRTGVGMILASQINTLLSEIEAHDGVVVFTTNRIGSLDPAMERRITAKIEFPFPDRSTREKIWERMIPKKCPLIDVDLAELATFPIAGGNIKNAVLNAARSAAHAKKKGIETIDFVNAIEKELDGIKSFMQSKKDGRGVASNESSMMEEIEMMDDTKLSVSRKRKKIPSRV